MVLAIVGVAVVGVAGAGAATTPSSKPATVQPSKVVPHVHLLTQRGRLNYAGPNCPGRGWNCTTSTRVLQIATDNGRNVGECTPSEGLGFTDAPKNQMCDIVQHGSNNTARCTERSSEPAAVQSCTIMQTGDSNRAFVDQDVNQNGTATQTSSQLAKVTQTGTQLNDIHLRQNATQLTSTGTVQAQDAHQEALVNQQATGSGTNALQLDQSQGQKASNGVTQTQNWTATAPTLCHPLIATTSTPNACADVTQTANTGDNATHIRQSIDEDVRTGAAAAVQKQQWATGGIDAHVELTSASGKSTNDTNQSKSQNASGPADAAQTQNDPMGCCGISAMGNDQSKETLDQSSTQKASSPLARQLLAIFGITHSPLGSCSITQHASDNADTSANNASESPCLVPLQLDTACTTTAPTESEDFVPGCVSFQPLPCIPSEISFCDGPPILLAPTRLN